MALTKERLAAIRERVTDYKSHLDNPKPSPNAMDRLYLYAYSDLNFLLEEVEWLQKLGEWNPIETAPKDDCLTVRLWDIDVGEVIGKYDAEKGHYMIRSNTVDDDGLPVWEFNTECQASHWQPLSQNPPILADTDTEMSLSK